MALNVTNRTAIVTGAGSGINLSFAKLLLSKGCNVIFADLALRPEAKAVVEEYGTGDKEAKGVFVQTDVTKWGQLATLFEVAENEFGNADIVVPGAGVFEPPFSNFWQPPGAQNSTSRDKAERSSYALIDINLNHPIRTTQLAIAHFLKHNKPGVVVHISSIAGQVPDFCFPMYIASKHALNGFIRSLAPLDNPTSMSAEQASSVAEGMNNAGKAREIPRIRVNGVAPGIIKTPLWTDNPEKMAIVKELDDWVTPEEVAEVMLSCIQDEAITGGSIIEIAGFETRRVEAFNDPGPARGRHPKLAQEILAEEVWSALGTEGWGQ